MLKIVLLASLVFAGCARQPAPSPDVAADLAAVRGSLEAWERHMEAGRYDSLRTLVSPDFHFIMEGRRLTYADLVSYIGTSRATDIQITLSNVIAHTRGDSGTIVYDAEESLKMAGTPTTAITTGSIVFRRDADRWRMTEWTVTPTKTGG